MATPIALSSRGGSPVIRTTQDVEPKQKVGELPVKLSGKEEEGGTESLRPLRRWTARLPTARLPFCKGGGLGGEEKLISVRRGCGVSYDREGAH